MTSNHGAQHHGEHPDHERIDQQVIQARMLALRVIAPPKSRIGQILRDRLEELYERLGDKIDPAKRRELTAANQDRAVNDSESKLDGPKEAPRDIGAASSLGAPVAELNIVVGASELQQDSPIVERADSIPATPKFRSSTDQTQQAVSQAAQTSWVWVLSQLLQTDLKRLGLEPDELNDIRVFLIKSEAAKYDKLQLLSRLPDSLSPEAITKIFEDIRTLAAGYVAFVMVEKARSEVEAEGELKQILDLPRSVFSPFYGIKTIEFDPEDILRKLG